MIIMKFGGSSVADAPCMRVVAERVHQAQESSPLVVLSAMGKTTNALFDMARSAEKGDLAGALGLQRRTITEHRRVADELFDGAVPEGLDEALTDLSGELELLLRGVAMLRELSPRSMDAIASIGERLATRIFAVFAKGEWLDARTVIRTDAVFGEAAPLPKVIRALAQTLVAPKLGPGRIVVTQGYIGATEDGLATTLGRGGSDYSAALLGAALGATEVQIWSDVEGVLTADPRIVPEALPIPDLSFAEAAELAAFGAKVLHPSTIQPAVEARIPVTVRHTWRPAGRFTTISAEARSGRPITALASRGPVTVLTVSSSRMLAQSGFLARLFEVFGRRGVSVDLVATAEVSVSLTVDAEVELACLVEELEAFATVEIHQGRTIIAAVGERLKSTPGLGAKLLTNLGDINVEMISMGANEINLSLVVQQDRADEALRRLHRVLVGGLA